MAEPAHGSAAEVTQRPLSPAVLLAEPGSHEAWAESAEEPLGCGPAGKMA